MEFVTKTKKITKGLEQNWDVQYYYFVGCLLPCKKNICHGPFFRNKERDIFKALDIFNILLSTFIVYFTYM